MNFGTAHQESDDKKYSPDSFCLQANYTVISGLQRLRRSCLPEVYWSRESKPTKNNHLTEADVAEVKVPLKSYRSCGSKLFGNRIESH